MKYKTVVLGGTFGPLHNGHKKMFETAFRMAEYISIGLTADEMVKHKKGKVPTYFERKMKLEQYLFEQGWIDRTKIMQLHDSYGNTLKDNGIEAIVVSPETKSNAEMINKIRSSKGYRPLDIILVDFVHDKNGKVISSTRIRAGEIDCSGNIKW